MQTNTGGFAGGSKKLCPGGNNPICGLPRQKKNLGRKVSILFILPALLLFVPFANRENFQLEGIVLIVLAGYLSKGFIHYCVAKIFGPLIWCRGFCGWACSAAAIK